MNRRAILLLATMLAACSTTTVPSPPRSPSAIASSSAEPRPVPLPRETPDAPFRSTAPALAEVAPFVPPTVRSFHLANGIPVLLVERSALGFVRIEALLRASPAPFGANTMAAQGLWLGNRTLWQTKLQALNDADMTSMSSSFAWGWIRVALTATSDHVAPAIARLGQVVQSPAFPASEVIRITRDFASDLEPSDNAPHAIAARVLPLALYGSVDLDDETNEVRSSDIGALRRDDIAHAYEAALDPSSTRLIVVGDATEGTLRPLLESAFGSWRGHAKPTPSKTKTTRLSVATSSPRLVVVNHPGSQTLITFGGEGPAFGSSDRAPSLALRMMVNGSKGRAATALHAEGITDVHPALNLLAAPSAPRVTVSVELATAQTAKALVAIDRLLRATKTADISPTELDSARRPVAIGEPLWTASLAGETDLLEGLVVQKLPADDVAKRGERILAVSAEDVHRVAASYLDPERMKIVVVGDWSKLRGPLLDLGWGPVEVRDAGGAVVKVEGAR